jgi:hypothetical protein
MKRVYDHHVSLLRAIVDNTLPKRQSVD